MAEAKTLNRSAGHLPYQATQAFWKRRGSARRTRSIHSRGRQPANPAAIYVAALWPVTSAD